MSGKSTGYIKAANFLATKAKKLAFLKEKEKRKS